MRSGGEIGWSGFCCAEGGAHGVFVEDVYVGEAGGSQQFELEH